ncbi:MAG: hypothetical protein M3245_03625 [Actinomycetota bacterium]|nr:hypothetical protein [Actinomycetota bacterium]
MAVLVATAVPAAAADSDPTPPCEASEQHAPLGLDGRNQPFTGQNHPSVGHDITGGPYDERSVSRFQYRLDVSGSAEKPTAKYGDVRLVLGWGDRGDFDIYVYDAFGRLGQGTRFNPQVGPGETVNLPSVEHCADLRIEVVNYLALPNTALTLATTVSNIG